MFGAQQYLFFYMTTPTFLPQSSFYAELRATTNQYFKDKGVNPTGNWNLWSKAIILLVAIIGFYVHLVFFTPPVAFALLECVILGAIGAFIGFNIMHDGAHGSFSTNRTLNKIAGLSLNLLGSNVMLWSTKHNVIHHTFTNVDGIDDDIDGKPFLRLAQTQKKYKMHRFQHFYFWILYALLYMFWVFYTDFQKYFTQKIGEVPLPQLSAADHISFWAYKIFYGFSFIGLPIYMLGFGTWIIGFLTFASSVGIIMSIVFQLAHTVEGTSFPMPTKEENSLEEEWAILQLKTTANFATKNKAISWFVGGLNFQIEHHLFPQISHVHYPELSKIVKSVCAKYNVPYIEYPKMRTAIMSHILHLRKMGMAS